jgi:cytosine/adenosine deaminase-related metal-dependent hydrolase
MIQKIQADWVHPISSPAQQDSVLIFNENGEILALEPASVHDPSSVRRVSGQLVPGFVNTHCHLELSHMLGQVDTGTGLIPFIKSVVTKRGMAAELIQEAIAKADAYMYEQGIVAVGDISNVTDTFAQKQVSKMSYYTFVECFDFLQDAQAQAEFDKYYSVYTALQTPQGSAKSLVPHAPYSVSPKLFQLINQANAGQERCISIHNQETPPENELFLTGGGDFPPFYQSFGIDMSGFKANGQPAIHYALAHLDPAHRTLFVHNSLSTREDIRAAQAWSNKTYWATCANANLYIENRLPNYQAFLDTEARVCIGTDSLTSNWQLSVLEELKTIARFQSYVPFETLLRWATLNGAQALGFDQRLGSFEQGKQPGINLLTGLDEKGFTSQTQVIKIA